GLGGDHILRVERRELRLEAEVRDGDGGEAGSIVRDADERREERDVAHARVPGDVRLSVGREAEIAREGEVEEVRLFGDGGAEVGDGEGARGVPSSAARGEER